MIDLNLKGLIQKPETTNSYGEVKTTWATAHTNVYMRRMAPLRGSQGQENNQTVTSTQATFLMWAIYLETDYRIVLSDQIYYVIGEPRPYKGDLNKILVDTELRDNEPRVEVGPDDMVVVDPDGQIIEKI